jgi:Bpu10I-like restriction endonuclease
MKVHGDNLTQKENHPTKYRDDESRQYLADIRPVYDAWADANERLRGPFREHRDNDDDMLAQRTRLFSDYKDFLDQQHYAEKFDSRSNLHSSVLEEFVYYLFRDLVLDFSEHALVGKAHTFKDIFFQPPDYDTMITRPAPQIETKDHDFVIGVNVTTTMRCDGQDTVETNTLQIPAIAIECKTYLDKTMLEGASTAAEQLKLRSPNAIYLVVSEWLKLTERINLRKFKVDQIYVLRKQKNTDREFRFLPDYDKNPIYDDVISHLFHAVRDHLTTGWEGGVAFGLDKGFLL